MIHSARLKLTLWYVAMLMTVSLIFSGILYHFATHELAEVIHRHHSSQDTDSGDSRFGADLELQSSSSNLLRGLIIFNGATLILASGACYFLANRTLRPIEEAHKKQSRFVADVSHELRTPLAALQVQIEATLLQTTRPRSLETRTLKGNLEEVARLKRLADNLLSLASDDAKTNNYKSDAISVKRLFNATKERLDLVAQNKLIAIKTKPTNTAILGDFDALLQALTVIVDNAVKYSPEKSSITLAATTDKRTVSVAVSDQGIGIEPEELLFVFDRFYRGDHARSHAVNDGLGLGLSLAKGIVEAHGGTITISNNQPHGTKVIITLPRAKASQT